MKKIVLGFIVAAVVGLGLQLMLMAKANEHPAALPANGDKLEVIAQDDTKKAVVDTSSVKEVSPHIMEAKVLIVFLDDDSKIAAQASLYEANCITMEYYVHDAVLLDIEAKVIRPADGTMTNFRKVPVNTPAASFWEFLCKAPLRGAEAGL